MSIIATIDIPEDLYLVLASHGFSKEVISKESKKLLALKCYKDKVLSLGKATELSGLTKWDFIEFLGDNNIAVIDYNEIQLDMELKEILKKAGEN